MSLWYVDAVISQQDFTSQQKKQLDEMAQGCFDILELKETLDEYQGLDFSVEGKL